MISVHRRTGLAAEPFHGTVERVKLIEYAQAMHLRNPIHFDREAAIAGGYRDVVAPPGYLTPLTMQPRSAKFETFDIDETKALAGEWRWQHFRPVCAGDRLHGQTTLVGVSRKQGKRPMDVLVLETRYLDEEDLTVLIVTDTTLEFSD